MAEPLTTIEIAEVRAHLEPLGVYSEDRRSEFLLKLIMVQNDCDRLLATVDALLIDPTYKERMEEIRAILTNELEVQDG